MRKLICFLFLSSLAFGQGGAQSGEILKSTAGLSGTVRVCTGTATGTPCSPLATIYSDAALTVPKTNPAASDVFGNYTYYASPGNYEEQLSSGTSRFTRHVSIGINSSSVVGSFLPSVTGGDLGSTSKRWDLFAGAIDATSAAITTLTATTGTIATLNSTTATIDAVTSTTGTVATLNSTTATVGTLSSTTSTLGAATATSFASKSIGSVRYADQFAGATADVKINAAIADLPAKGGTVDARGFGAGDQTIAATVNVGLNSGTGKTVTLLVDRTTNFICTITNNTPCWIRNAGSSIIASGTVANPNAGFTLSASAAVSNILLTVDDQSLNLVGGYVEGVFIFGHTGATVSDAMLGVRNALQVTQFSNITVNSNGSNSVVGLKVYGNGASINVGNVQFSNIQVDTLGSSSSYPVWIGCAAAGSLTPIPCASVNTVSFLGASALVHPSAGNPIVTIESRDGAGGTNVVGNINFYGTQIESASNTDIGIFDNGAESVHIYGLYGTCHTSCGADLIKLSAPAGTTLDGVDIRGVDNQGGWTNTLNNTANSSTFAFATYTRLNYAYAASGKIANVTEGAGSLLQPGGSAGKATCWKSGAKSLGYCSTVVDASGNCTCN
jgi:hypothetical protein